MNTRMHTKNHPPAGVTLSPKVPGFLISQLAPEGFGALLTDIKNAQVPYPLIDTDVNDPHKCWVTFLWAEDQPANPASAVILSANAMVGQTNLELCEYEQVSEELWAITLHVPADWIASYRLTVHRGREEAPWRAVTERRAIRLAADAGGVDPLNPKLGAGMHGAPVSVVHGPAATASKHLAAATPILTRSGPAIGGWGEVTPPDSPLPERVQAHQIYDTNCSRMRQLFTYSPPVAAVDTPLLVVHDGATWVHFQAVAATLDSAIRAGAIPPLHALFVDSTDTQLRSAELPVLVGTTRSLAEQFLPWARDLLPVSSQPSQTVLTGSSFGGLATLLGVVHYPELVGLALAQSPSLWHTDLSEQLAQLDPQSRVLVQAGQFETQIYESCQQTMQMLASAPSKDRIEFHFLAGGHDWAWWTTCLIPGLAQLLNPEQ